METLLNNAFNEIFFFFSRHVHTCVYNEIFVCFLFFSVLSKSSCATWVLITTNDCQNSIQGFCHSYRVESPRWLLQVDFVASHFLCQRLWNHTRSHCIIPSMHALSVRRESSQNLHTFASHQITPVKSQGIIMCSQKKDKGCVLSKSLLPLNRNLNQSRLLCNKYEWA